jgi:hypothetical protein
MEKNYKELYETLSAKAQDLNDLLLIEKAKVLELTTGESPTFSGVSYRMHRKLYAQRKALRSLNRRVRVQRLQLRKLNEMERGLRPEEWVALKNEHAHELEEDQWDLTDL